MRCLTLSRYVLSSQLHAWGPEMGKERPGDLSIMADNCCAVPLNDEFTGSNASCTQNLPLRMPVPEAFGPAAITIWSYHA